MKHFLPLVVGGAQVLMLAALAPPLGAQGFPVISTRQFSGGSVKVIVKGPLNITEDVPINAKASFGDGEMTWLQFGVSGSNEARRPDHLR